jgi:hypothetical protein
MLATYLTGRIEREGYWASRPKRPQFSNKLAQYSQPAYSTRSVCFRVLRGTVTRLWSVKLATAHPGRHHSSEATAARRFGHASTLIIVLP